VGIAVSEGVGVGPCVRVPANDLRWHVLGNQSASQVTRLVFVTRRRKMLRLRICDGSFMSIRSNLSGESGTNSVDNISRSGMHQVKSRES
jgi:hypothetical protein